MSKEFYRGEIFYIRNESEYSGNVQGGGRPAVIISNDIGNNAEDETGAVAKRQELPFETLEDEHFLEEIGIPETHIEYKILMDDAFFEHLHLKRIVIDKDIPFPMSTFERMLRYAKYGYFPCKETKMKIINALRDLTDEQVELSESLYDGMD